MSVKDTIETTFSWKIKKAAHGEEKNKGKETTELRNKHFLREVAFLCDICYHP